MKVEAIREAGRATQGVKLINLDGGDEIAAIARIQEQEEDEVEETEGGETPITPATDATDTASDITTPTEE